MWTAQEAAEKSQYHQHEIMYNLICNGIKTAVCTGKREYVFPDEVFDSIKEEFEALGYRVVERWDYYDGINFQCHTYIDW